MKPNLIAFKVMKLELERIAFKRDDEEIDKISDSDNSNDDFLI